MFRGHPIQKKRKEKKNLYPGETFNGTNIRLPPQFPHRMKVEFEKENTEALSLPKEIVGRAFDDENQTFT